MLLLVEKGIRGGIFHSIYRYATANYKYMKDYHRNKKSSYLKYRDVSNLHGWAMSQKRPVNNFEWINDNSQFNGDFIKTITKTVMKDIFLKSMFNILKNCMTFTIIYYFYQKK